MEALAADENKKIKHMEISEKRWKAV
ncbi:MAG: hypothetical protein OD814_001862, partial [Candidatus Alkanophagales archaeon MCA70_species_1]|nr:hypothetical protein [Candidatus Alkanophaga volatiphilum]